MAEEFEESNRLLDHWGQLQTIKLLAFPVGSYSADVLKAAQPYFVYAFATGDRLADPSVIKSQGHSIPRFNIHHASPAEIFAFINGFHGMINRIFSGLR